MKQNGMTATSLILSAGMCLVSCSQPSGTSADMPAPASTVVDAKVQQRVKNGCIEHLQTRASEATAAPGLLHPQKITLVRMAYLSDVQQIVLPDGAVGYELGLEFAYKAGRADPRTDRKLCRINLADSSVELADPDADPR